MPIPLFADAGEALRALAGGEHFSSRPCSGGCIHRSSLLSSGKQSFFLKENSSVPPDLFRAEAAGLKALADQCDDLRIPRVRAAGSGFLLLEAIIPGSRVSSFWTRFGEGLARLHGKRVSDRFGFEHSNYLGTTVQENRPLSSSWIDFFRERRLIPQIRLASPRLGDSLKKNLADLLEKLDRLLSEPEHPSLLHGDLWSGNYMVDSRGLPVLVDPAVYYGHPEADLALTELFGGYPPEFYRAYQSIRPLRPGYPERKALYNLYHMLNHFNLFGDSYRDSVRAIVHSYR